MVDNSADLASMEIEGGGSAFDYNPMEAQVSLNNCVVCLFVCLFV